MIEELRRLRREKSQLQEELGTLVLSSSEHEHARDGVDYRYMRAVRIQGIDRQIAKLKREGIRLAD